MAASLAKITGTRFTETADTTAISPGDDAKWCSTWTATDAPGDCTERATAGPDYFSYRRDGRTGRQAMVVVRDR